MAEKIPPYFEEKVSFSSRLFLQKRQWFTSAAACAAGAALLVAYVQAGPGANAYARTERAFSKWEAHLDDEALYAEMQEALKKTPALEDKYRARIAQHLLNAQKFEEGLPLAERSLALLRQEAPLHAAYAETSLLIEQRAFQSALERAVSLKEQMERELGPSRLFAAEPLLGGVALYAHNLLRIAFLQKELGNRPGERAAWEEVQNFLKEGTPLKGLIFGNFREKGLDLSHYIVKRKRELDEAASQP